VGLGVVGLADDHIVDIALPAPPENEYLFPGARVVGVEDLQQLRLMFAGTM
jgi:hypothetical protein